MENRSLWKFGTREVVYTAIGAALFFVLSFLFIPLPGTANVSLYPAVVIPMFFGIVFGPIVGFLTGFIGHYINGLVTGGVWIWWTLGIGIIGFICGLVSNQLTSYKDRISIIRAELFVVLSVIVGIGVSALSEMWVSGADINTVIFANFLPAAIGDILVGVVLVPILMIAYDAVISRSGR